MIHAVFTNIGDQNQELKHSEGDGLHILLRLVALSNIEYHVSKVWKTAAIHHGFVKHYTSLETVINMNGLTK